MTPKETDENACCSDLRAMMAREASGRVNIFIGKAIGRHHSAIFYHLPPVLLLGYLHFMK